MSRRQVALVTGGRRGIGLAIAEALAQAGFDIAIADLAPDAGDAATRIESLGARCLYLAGDISDLASHAVWHDAIAETYGHLDCLVNNAGIGTPERGDALTMKPEAFDRVISVNLRGTVFLTNTMLALMRRQSDAPASVITITSVSAALVSPERLDYCMSKAALAMWCRGLAVRLAPEGISVFDVRPGIIRSDMTSAVAARYDGLIGGGLVPAGRWGEGSDVARVVASLASGAFGFATGSVIDVDGGLGIARL